MRRRHRRHGLRRRYGHAGKMPLRVLERNLARLKKVVRARGGRV